MVEIIAKTSTNITTFPNSGITKVPIISISESPCSNSIVMVLAC